MLMYHQEHVSVIEMAAHLGVERHIVYRWVEKARSRVVKHNRQIYLSLREVVRMLTRLEDIPDEHVDRLFDFVFDKAGVDLLEA